MTVTERAACRVCGGDLEEFLDLGRQPVSQSFREPGDATPEFGFRLAVARCSSCTMVQLVEAVPRELMFHEHYPFRSSGSAALRDHFGRVARRFLETGTFIVEIGCNDGAMLAVVARAGVRHVGFEPSGQAARAARDAGVRVRTDFFDEHAARALAAEEGPADVVYAANTMGHIPDLPSVLRGVDALLGPDGVLVVEDFYLGDVLARTSFDQINDEHFYLFTAHSVLAAGRLHGLDLIDVERLAVHGGEMRFTLARAGRHTPSPAVAALLAEEEERGLAGLAALCRFATDVARIRDDLVATLSDLRSRGLRVVGYGATAKSATVLNFCEIGPDLVSFICDTTPAKQNRVTPGRHIPIRPATAFAEPYPDYALLFAWDHAEQILAREQEFRRAGGRWLLYVPDVHLL